MLTARATATTRDQPQTMKKTIQTLAILFIAAVSFAAGFVFRDADSERNYQPAQKELAAARGRIAELEGALAAAKTKAVAAQRRRPRAAATNETEAALAAASTPAATNETAGAEQPGRVPREQMVEAINELKARLQTRSKNRYEYLCGVDVSRMSESERANHEKFLKLMARREALSEKTKDKLVPDPATMREYMALEVAMRPYAKAERSALMRGVARDLGYEGEDAEIFHDTLDAVFDCTAQNSFGDFIDNVVEMSNEAGEDGKSAFEGFELPTVEDDGL